MTRIREYVTNKKTSSEKDGLLAIVGRPNVGKSTLFNRLVGSRRAIVGDEPGITRDRLYGEVHWNGRKFRVVDTGGIVPDDLDLIPFEIFKQARVALDEAAAIVMVVDGRTELASPDLELARLLQKTGKPLYLAVNKIDNQKYEAAAQNFRRLGIKNLLPTTGTAVRGVTSGKVAVSKALRHHKLPDQDQIKRIYTEIESKDERLELNLYIVGEAGGEEEGAMAEGSQE